MSEKELADKLNDPNLTSKQRDYIVRELKERIKVRHPELASEIDGLFGKYMEFKLSENEKGRFAEMLGIDRKNLNQPWPPGTNKEDTAYYLSKHNNDQLKEIMSNKDNSPELRNAAFQERFARVVMDPANENDRDWLQGLFDKWKNGGKFTLVEIQYLAKKMQFTPEQSNTFLGSA
jgi:hypothetical protein